jgi:hypothetical protein
MNSADPRSHAAAFAAAALLAFAATSMLAQDPPPSQDPKPLPKAEDVIDAYVAATGGREAHDKLNSLVVVSECRMSEGMTITMTQKSKAPDKRLTRITMATFGEQAVGFDGLTAWSKDPTGFGARELKGDARDAVAREARFNGRVHWRKDFKEARSVAIESVNGRECVLVELVPESGEPVREWYDLETHLVARVRKTQENPSGSQALTLEPSDWKEVSGVRMWHTLKLQPGSMPAMVFKVKSIEVNVPIADSEFAMPAKPEAPPKDDGGRPGEDKKG